VTCPNDSGYLLLQEGGKEEREKKKKKGGECPFSSAGARCPLKRRREGKKEKKGEGN